MSSISDDVVPNLIYLTSYARAMAISKLEFSRRWIGAGFLLFALASIGNLLSFGNTIFHVGVRLEVQMLFDPVSALLTLMGWLFLTQLRSRDSFQSKLLAAGFLALALQFAALSLGQILRASGVVIINWSSAQFWLALTGYVAATVGFLMAFNFIRGSGESARVPERPTSSAPASSRLIFVGFALLAISSMVILYFDVSNRLFTVVGIHNVIENFTQPMAALFAALGWWFLSHLDGRDDEQRTLIHQAYWALGLALAANAIQQFLAISEVSGLSQFTWELWISAVGCVVAAVGFILTARRPVAIAKSSALTSTP